MASLRQRESYVAGQVNKFAVLLDALDGVGISDAERAPGVAGRSGDSHRHNSGLLVALQWSR